LYNQDKQGPDWFVVLSGADYPIKPAKYVLNSLNAGSYDAHIPHELIEPDHLKTHWQQLYRDRYFGIRTPHVTRKLKFVWRHRQVPRFLRRFVIPFSARFRCYVGSQWFCANRRTANYILEPQGRHKALARHGRRLQFPEEMYFQTMFANSEFLKLNNDNHRYIDWSEGLVHPKTLTMDDVPALLGSSAHFARKFAHDRIDVLDAIDAAVDQGSVNTAAPNA
jgi:hypothetical protein